MAYKYLGWIPCVSGKLYFELTACDAINDVGYLNVNIAKSDTASRHLLVASEVDWEDVKSNATEGLWNVVLLASCGLNSSELMGSVFLVPRQIKDLDDKLIHLMKSVPESLKDGEDICEIQTKLEQFLGEHVKDRRTFKSDFLLKDNGIVYLNSPNGIDEDEKQLVCRQSYYYLKYTFHKDKHHSRSESLTTVHKFEKSDGMGTVLINDIKKALVTLKRTIYQADYKCLFAAKGILSYSKSLLVTCKAEGLLNDSQYISEKAYIDNMAESLEIMGRKIEGELTARASYDSNARSIGLLMLAAIAPFTLMYKDEVVKHIDKNMSQNSHIVRALEWLVGSESHILIVLLFIILAYFFCQSLYLRYGSPTFAVRKFNLISIGLFEYALESYRSAKVMLTIVYFIIGVLTMIILYRLF